MTHTLSRTRRAYIFLTGFVLVTLAMTVIPNRAYLMSKLASLRSTDGVTVVDPQPKAPQSFSNGSAGLGAASSLLFQGPGIAPTGDPGQGFDIEGNLQANTPNANTTDWVPGVAGTGVGVLTAAGVPVDPTKTFRIVDLYNSQSDDIFTGGSKVNDNPNTNWNWATGKPTAKDDINNALLHVSMDANNHLWFVVGGDRLSNNGDSHINFEFLQNTLVKNGDGTFTSAGPNGGRTVGDLLLHIDLQQGGNVPDFLVDRWQAVGAGFDWVTITPAAGTIFVAANVAGTTPVPFGAFGSTTYAMNQFAEGAIDITALIANFDPCIGISTLFIKTATSQAPSAALKDMIEPIQLNLGNRPVAQAGADQTTCLVAGSPNPTSFTVNGTATNGTPAWTVASTTGTITNADVTIVNPTSATTAVNIAPGKIGSVTLTFTVTSNRVPPCNPAATDQVVLTVTQGAVAIAPADVTKCQTIGQPTVFSLTGQVTAGSSPPLWSYVSSTGTILAGDVTIATPNNPTTGVSIAAGKLGSVTLRLTSATTACGTAFDDVVLTVSAAPTADAGLDLATCQAVSGPTIFNLNGTVSNSSGSTWSYVSSTGTILQTDVTIVNPFFPSTTVNIANGKTGTVTLALTAVGTKPSCANAVDEVILTVKALPNCQITGSTSVCAGSINNTYTAPAGANLSYNWSVTGSGSIVGSTTGQSVNITAGVAGSYTVMLTVADTVTECSSSCSLPVTVNANPTCSISGATAVCATSTNNTYTGPAGANLSYSWSVIGNGSIVGSTTGQSVNVSAGAAGSYTV
ncbi:MAG TPA: hypothetical protein PLK30_10850, partial [Blastocatellia bacterium]|nr:hypothetical protein [Blastocatellia bacterium]